MNKADKEALFEKRPHLKNLPEGLEYKARQKRWSDYTNAELVKLYNSDRPAYDKLLSDYLDREK